MVVKKKNMIVSGWLVVGLISTGCGGPKMQGAELSEKKKAIIELKQAISELNTRMEDLNNRFSLLQEKVTSNAEQIQELSDTYTRAPLTPPEDLKVVKLEEDTVSPEQFYSQAQDLFLSGRYRDARVVFSELVNTYPSHELTDNALYWMGETYYTEEDYRAALKIFKSIVENYPRANKAPAAMLKWGYSLIELGSLDEAVEVLNRLLKKYPHSKAAHKARDKLENIKTNRKDGIP